MKYVKGSQNTLHNYTHACDTFYYHMRCGQKMSEKVTERI